MSTLFIYIYKNIDLKLKLLQNNEIILRNILSIKLMKLLIRKQVIKINIGFLSLSVCDKTFQ
jgi:hypothetical protein